MKIAFVELISESRDVEDTYTPNIFYALAKNDLTKAGHECDILKLKTEELFFREEVRKEFIDYITSKRYDLIGFSRSYNSTINALSYYIRNALPNAKIVFGGVNAINDLYRDWDYLVQGAGRKAIFQLTRFLSGEVDVSSVPNLFYKKDGLIYHTERFEKIDINKELIDFYPDYRTIKFGAMKKRKTMSVNILGSFGCLYNKSIKDNPLFFNLEITESFKDLDESAQRVLNSYLSRIGRGCSFCNICVDREYTAYPNKDIVNKLIDQLKYITSFDSNLKNITLIDEYPYRYLYNLIKEIIKKKIPIDIINVGGRADWFYQNRETVRKTVKLLENTRLKIAFGSIGYENFSQRELDLFNKGVKVKTNLLVVEELFNLKNKYPNNFGYHICLIILFNPWTRLKDIEINIKTLLRLKDKLKFDFYSTFCTLQIFPFTALYYKAKKDKLLIKDKHFSDIPCKYKFKDPRVEEIWSKYYDFVFKKLPGIRGSDEYYSSQIKFLERLVLIVKNKKPTKSWSIKDSFTLKVGKQCNNNCIYCNYLDYKAEKDYTTKELKSFINRAVKDGYRRIIFPCNSDIRKDFLELLSYAEKKDLKISLMTNGRIFSIKQNLISILKLNIDHISIYLNSSRKDIHELLNNAPGSFEQTINAINNINELRRSEKFNHQILTWSVFTVLTRLNYDNLSELNDLINDSSCNSWVIKCILKKKNVDYKTNFTFKKYCSDANIVKRLPKPTELI
jgi:hypothetical protein